MPFKIPEKPNELIQSRKFWATICAVAIPIVNRHFHLDLDSSEISSIMAVICAYVIGTGLEKK